MWKKDSKLVRWAAATGVDCTKRGAAAEDFDCRLKEKYKLSEDAFCYIASGNQFYIKLLKQYGLMLHASAVELDGKAYLFSANSGTGKSTHTRLWQSVFGEKAQVFNDDKPALRYLDGTWYAYGTPWSGKHGLDANVCVPLKGLCILERGTDNHIRRITAEEAMPMLQKQAYRPLSQEKEPVFLTLIAQLSASVPLWKMACNKEAQAATMAHEAMKSQ